MSRQNTSNNNKRSLAEIVIIVIMVAVLMMSFIHYFFKQEAQITKVGFNTLKQNFSTKITTVHAQWLMDKKPNIVMVEISGSTQHVLVNQLGWVDVKSDDVACEKIWQQVMTEPLFFMKLPITAKNEATTIDSLTRICTYTLLSGEFFKYNSKNGKVSQVLNTNVSS